MQPTTSYRYDDRYSTTATQHFIYFNEVTNHYFQTFLTSVSKLLYGNEFDRLILANRMELTFL